MRDWTMIKAVNITGADDGRVFASKTDKSGLWRLAYSTMSGLTGIVLNKGVVPAPVGSIDQDVMEQYVCDGIDDVAIECLVNSKPVVVAISSFGMSTVDGEDNDVIYSSEELDYSTCGEGTDWEGIFMCFDLG